MKKKGNNQYIHKILLIPSKLLFSLTLICMVLGCVAFLFSFIYIIWIIAGFILLAFIITDAFLVILLCDRFKIKREVPASCAQDEPINVKLFISRQGRPICSHKIKIFDLYPDSMKTDIFPLTIKYKENQVLEYILTPFKREKWYFSGIHIFINSPLFFWKLRITHEIISTGKTFPNFKKIARGEDLKGKFEKGDILKIRKRGDGLDFESLREFKEGDSIRLIDWRATSRNRELDGRLKLIVKNYQEEQDQNILFIIDSGYRLPDNQFDSSLNAMLLLSYIALKHGDSVTVSSFGSRELWIPPKKGVSAYSKLMNELFDLHSEPVPSSPFLALENALNRLKKRSLIILISNFREEDDKPLSLIIKQIQKQHLLLMVSFHEEVEALAYPEQMPKNNDELLTSAAAYTYLTNRKKMFAKWEHSGLLVLETTPKHISTTMINKYLSIKKSGKL